MAILETTTSGERPQRSSGPCDRKLGDKNWNHFKHQVNHFHFKVVFKGLGLGSVTGVSFLREGGLGWGETFFEKKNNASEKGLRSRRRRDLGAGLGGPDDGGRL